MSTIARYESKASWLQQTETIEINTRERGHDEPKTKISLG